MKLKNKCVSLLIAFYKKYLFHFKEKKKLLKKLHKASLVSLAVLTVLINFNIFVLDLTAVDIYILLVKLINFFSHLSTENTKVYIFQ